MNQPCQCDSPGLCPRMRRPMVGRLHELCQHREDYRDLFDRQALDLPALSEPSLARKALSYVGAVARNLWHGRPQSPEEVQAARLAVCRGGCPNYQPEKDSCKLCGCGLPAKAAMPHMTCPDGKWPGERNYVGEWKIIPNSNPQVSTPIETYDSRKFEQPAKLAVSATLKPPPVSAGVCLGSYRMPALIELQIRLIRDTNGWDVPVLIAEDRCDNPAVGKAFAALEKKYPAVEHWPNDTRLGHWGSDCQNFWKALNWAHVRGFKFVAKVSQRFLLLRPNWLEEACKSLEESGDAVYAQDCMDSGVNLYVRTEFMVMDVAKWATPEVLQRLYGQKLGGPTELAVNDVIERNLEGKRLRPEWLTVDRYKASPGTVFHTSHVPQFYFDLAKRYGIELDPDFSTAGWPSIEGASYKS